MKNKKILSAMFAAVVICGLASISVFAENDTSWYNEDQSEFTVSTADQLAGMAELVNSGNSFAEKTITLGSNIDLSGVEWTPIGNRSGNLPFKGNFNGNNKVVSNLTMTNSTVNGGLFGYVLDATIEKLTLEDVSITTSGKVGGLCAYVGGNTEISDITVSGTVTGDKGGGIIGYVSDPNPVSSNDCNPAVTVQVTNCENLANVNAKKAAGVLAHVEYSNLIVTNCINRGTVTATEDHCAGVVGYVMRSASTSISNCENYGNISGWANVGGILSTAHQGAFTVDNCINKADIISEYRCAGGIIGRCNQKIVVSNCTSEGNISVTKYEGYAGGIVGYDDNASATSTRDIINSSFNGTVTSLKTNGTGGIIGGIQDKGTIRIKDCTSTGNAINAVGENSGYTTVEGFVGIGSAITNQVSEDNIATGFVTEITNTANTTIQWEVTSQDVTKLSKIYDLSGLSGTVKVGIIISGLYDNTASAKAVLGINSAE